MKRFFCWLTGGHRYADNNLKSSYNPYTRNTLLVNHCVKCGKPYAVIIDTDGIVQRDMEEYAKRHRVYAIKGGADNE